MDSGWKPWARAGHKALWNVLCNYEFVPKNEYIHFGLVWKKPNHAVFDYAFECGLILWQVNNWASCVHKPPVHDSHDWKILFIAYEIVMKYL